MPKLSRACTFKIMTWLATDGKELIERENTTYDILARLIQSKFNLDVPPDQSMVKRLCEDAQLDTTKLARRRPAKKKDVTHELLAINFMLLQLLNEMVCETSALTGKQEREVLRSAWKILKETTSKLGCEGYLSALPGAYIEYTPVGSGVRNIKP